MNLDLVIAGVDINLGEHFGSRLLIKQDVNVWKWILVLDGDYIEQSVIHTYTQLLVLLLYKQC
jgi:hypothetical protein